MWWATEGCTSYFPPLQLEENYDQVHSQIPMIILVKRYLEHYLVYAILRFLELFLIHD